jgi:DUF1009 family protein
MQHTAAGGNPSKPQIVLLSVSDLIATFPDNSAERAIRGAGRRVLGILAGGGVLPGRVAAAARAAGRAVFLIGLEGFADAAVLEPYPHAFIRMGAAGRILDLLRRHGCEDLVMVGPVRRPSLFDMRPDIEGTRILARIGRAAFAGDDGLLAAVMRVLSEEGFRVLGPHEIMTEALGPAGQLTRIGADALGREDIARGVAVVRALGGADVGQAAVVQQGIVIAVEAVEGTDAMLARCGALQRPGPGGVLVKLVKPGQDRRADLPTIGPETVRGAASAGLRGIAFQAGGTILVERDETIASAERAGLFLVGLSLDDQEAIGA